MTAPLASVPVVEEDEQRLAEIRKRREALSSTDGVWSYSRSREPWMGVFQTTGNGYTFPVARVFGGEDEEERHARFIAWAPGDIDYLLTAVQSLRTQLEAAQEDSRRLDFLAKIIDRDGGIMVQTWDHDGRRLIPKDAEGYACLMVHRFAKRGGTDESLAEAIDAARTPTPPERGQTSHPEETRSCECSGNVLSVAMADCA